MRQRRHHQRQGLARAITANSAQDLFIRQRNGPAAGLFHITAAADLDENDLAGGLDIDTIGAVVVGLCATEAGALCAIAEAVDRDLCIGNGPGNGLAADGAEGALWR